MEGRNEFFGDQFGDSAVPIGILVEPRGAKADVALAHADLVAVVDLRRWKVVKTLKAGLAPDGLAYTTVDTKPAAAPRLRPLHGEMGPARRPWSAAGGARPGRFLGRNGRRTLD